MATMITTVSAPSPSHVSNLHLQNRYRLLPTEKSQSRHLPMNNIYQYKSSFSTYQISPVSFTKTVVFWKLYAAMDSNSTPPPARSNVPQPNLPAWIRCIVGVIVSLVQPFWKFVAGAKLLALGRQIEDTVEMVENVTEMVENVAEAVDKALSGLVKKLPKDGFLKDTARLLGTLVLLNHCLTIGATKRDLQYVSRASLNPKASIGNKAIPLAYIQVTNILYDQYGINPIITFVMNISKEVADDAEDAIEFIDKVEKVKAELESIVEDVIEGNCDAKEGEAVQEKVKDVQIKVEARVETSEEETKETGKNEIDRAGLGTSNT